MYCGDVIHVHFVMLIYAMGFGIIYIQCILPIWVIVSYWLDMNTRRIKGEHNTHNLGMVLVYTYQFNGITIH